MRVSNAILPSLLYEINCNKNGTYIQLLTNIFFVHFDFAKIIIFVKNSGEEQNILSMAAVVKVITDYTGGYRLSDEDIGVLEAQFGHHVNVGDFVRGIVHSLHFLCTNCFCKHFLIL